MVDDAQDDEELERLAKLSPEELDAELRKEGIDPAESLAITERAVAEADRRAGVHGRRAMSKIERVDVARCLLDIHPDRSIATRIRKPGPPERIDGMTVGIQMITEDAPHGGEMHPDGDELLYVISGRFRVTGDSEPNAPIELGPGEACIVPRGEWHLVSVLEPGQLVNITPGPRGDHRPLKNNRVV